MKIFDACHNTLCNAHRMIRNIYFLWRLDQLMRIILCGFLRCQKTKSKNDFFRLSRGSIFYWRNLLQRVANHINKNTFPMRNFLSNFKNSNIMYFPIVSCSLQFDVYEKTTNITVCQNYNNNNNNNNN